MSGIVTFPAEKPTWPSSSRRWVSHRGVLAAASPPFAWLGLFYGLAALLRLSLGRWPERLNENPHGWLFNLHFNATGLGFIGILLGLLVVPAATLILLAWPSRRRWALYPLIFGAATLLAWVLLHLAPASFLYLWWD